MDEERNSKFHLALDESLRLLSQQEATLDELRARTGTLLGLFVVAGSFFGSPLLRAQRVSNYQLAALAGFLLVVILQCSVLLVKGPWNFNTKVEDNLDAARSDESLEEMYVALIEEIERMAEDNDTPLGRLQRRFNFSLVAAIMSFGLWAIAVLVH